MNFHFFYFSGPVQSMVLCEKEKFLVTGGSDGFLAIWNHWEKYSLVQYYCGGVWLEKKRACACLSVNKCETLAGEWISIFEILFWIRNLTIALKIAWQICFQVRFRIYFLLFSSFTMQCFNPCIF